MEVWGGGFRCADCFPASGEGLAYSTLDQCCLSLINAGGGVQPPAKLIFFFSLSRQISAVPDLCCICMHSRLW